MATGQQQTVLRHPHRMLGVPDNGDQPDRLLLQHNTRLTLRRSPCRIRGARRNPQSGEV